MTERILQHSIPADVHFSIKRDGTIVKDYYDIKTSIDYKVEELLEGERDGKQRG